MTSTPPEPVTRSRSRPGGVGAAGSAVPDPVAHEPLLTREQEVDLARRFHDTGCIDSRNTLVERNIGLVRAIAREISFSGRAALDDLVAEGNMAMIRAAERFDPDRGVRFATYAAPWIRNAMRAARSQSARPLRVPGRVLHELHTLARATQALTTQLGRTPTSPEIAASVGISVARVRELHARLHLVAPAGPATDPSLAEDPKSEQSDGTESAAGAPELGSDAGGRLRSLVHSLPEREREAVERCFGFGRGTADSIVHAANALGTDRASIARDLRRGLARLRQGLQSE